MNSDNQLKQMFNKIINPIRKIVNKQKDFADSKPPESFSTCYDICARVCLYVHVSAGVF